MSKAWIGKPPKECQLCLSPLKTTFIDGKTLDGAWAIMCPHCFKVYGVGLGVGKGQEYLIAKIKEYKKRRHCSNSEQGGI